MDSERRREIAPALGQTRPLRRLRPSRPVGRTRSSSERNHVIDDWDADAPTRHSRNGGRSVIGTAFVLLDHIGALEPVRLLDLAEATGIPRASVHRLLKQLIKAGAVRRDGTRYRLGPSLLRLGARVNPERRLRVAARCAGERRA